MIKRFFPNWDLLRRSKMCRYCPGDQTPGVARVKVGSVDVRVCGKHIDDALDDVILNWDQVK